MAARLSPNCMHTRGLAHRRRGARSITVAILWGTSGSAVGRLQEPSSTLRSSKLLLEFLPLGGGGFAVLGLRPAVATVAEECAVGVDEFVVEDREIGLGGREAAMAKQLGWTGSPPVTASVANVRPKS